MKKGYKVVIRHSAFLISCAVLVYYVKYVIGEFVKRRKYFGPLAVFVNMDYVEMFLNVNPKLAKAALIFECEYIPSKDDTLWLITEHGSKSVSVIAPNGTRYADSVKLIREVAA